MKKVICFINVVLVLLFTSLVLGCSTDPEEVSFTDGAIYVKNNSGKNITAKVTAVNRNLVDGNTIYAQRVEIGKAVSIKKGKTAAFDFNFSKFIEDNYTDFALMISDGSGYWWWYYYDVYYLYNQTTTVTVTYNSAEGKFVQSAVYSGFEYKIPDLGYYPYYRDVQVTNSSDISFWAGFVGFDGSDGYPPSWKYLTSLGERIYIEPGETKTVRCFYSLRSENDLMGLTAVSQENWTSTWRYIWPNTMPVSFDINYNTSSYEFIFTPSYADEEE